MSINSLYKSISLAAKHLHSFSYLDLFPPTPPFYLNPSISHITGKLRVSELHFEVPKDHNNPSLGVLQIFARGVTRHEKPAAVFTEDERRKNLQKPYFVFLQGGPGFGCPTPQDSPITKTILDRGYQLLFLDQRGTGLSSPITAATLALQGDVRRQADYLKLFRADSIVKDCEAIRKTLTHDYPTELKVPTDCQIRNMTCECVPD